MRLIVDAMGGDHAPDEIVWGAARALQGSPDLELIFTGDRERIEKVLEEKGLTSDRIRIEHTTQVVEMEDDPLVLIRSKKESSMARGLALLRDGEGDAFLSAGSTGALLVGASSRIYKNRLPGIKRCAIGSVLPFEKPVLLLDSGANPEVSPEEMVQFAHLGKAYVQAVFGLEEPRIGLVNNGGEETKGTPTYVEAHRLLKEDGALNFVGNVEGRDLPLGACDVAVCDGFTGNVILKLSEGFGKFLSRSLESMFRTNLSTKMAYLAMRKELMAFKQNLSYEKYGGAPLLGTIRPVIKAHGSSKANAVESAVRQAEKFAASGVTDTLLELFSKKTAGES